MEHLRRMRTVSVGVASLLISATVVVALLAIASTHAWDGAAPLLLLSGGMALLLLVTGAWRSPAVWLGCVGVYSVALGAGVGRQPSGILFHPYAPDIWAPVLVAGAVLIIAAFVWAIVRIRRGLDRLPHVPVAMIALLLMSGGVGGAILVLRSLLSYPFYPGGHPFTGRPVRRDGRALTPARANGSSTVASEPWLEAASHEAAAVTAFAELAARLESVGAPADLISRSQGASIDEIRHTRLCDRIAGAFGAAAEPTAIPPVEVHVHTYSRAGRHQEILRLALESFVDGIVGEGYSAACLAEGSQTIDTRKGAPVLGAIAADELRHATLGADIVRWCYDESPTIVGRGLRWSVSRIPATVVTPESRYGLDEDELLAVGLPDEATSQALWTRTLDDAMNWLVQLLSKSIAA